MDQRTNDEEHLRLLSIFHYVVAAVTGLMACMPLLHVGVGLAMMSGGFDAPDQEGPPAAFGLIFVLVGGFFVFLGWSMAIALALAGRWLRERRNRTACIVVAAISCCFFPFGTALGVFSLITLTRPSVQALFEESAEIADGVAPPPDAEI